MPTKVLRSPSTTGNVATDGTEALRKRLQDTERVLAVLVRRLGGKVMVFDDETLEDIHITVRPCTGRRGVILSEAKDADEKPGDAGVKAG